MASYWSVECSKVDPWRIVIVPGPVRTVIRHYLGLEVRSVHMRAILRSVLGYRCRVTPAPDDIYTPEAVDDDKLIHVACYHDILLERKEYSGRLLK